MSSVQNSGWLICDYTSQDSLVNITIHEHGIPFSTNHNNKHVSGLWPRRLVFWWPKKVILRQLWQTWVYLVCPKIWPNIMVPKIWPNIYIYISWLWLVIGKCHTFHLFVSPIVPSLPLSLSKSMTRMIPKDFSLGIGSTSKQVRWWTFELINRCDFSTDFCRYPIFFCWRIFGYSLGMATEHMGYRHVSPVSVSMEPYLAGQDWWAIAVWGVAALTVDPLQGYSGSDVWSQNEPKGGCVGWRIKLHRISCILDVLK